MIRKIVAKVDEYLSGNISLPEFKDWFFEISFDVENRYAGATVELVHEIEGILAEASSGNWDSQAVRKYLRATSNEYGDLGQTVIVFNLGDSPFRSAPLRPFRVRGAI